MAADVLAQKYFRKAGIPAKLMRFEESTVPSWLWRSVPDQAALDRLGPDRLGVQPAPVVGDLEAELARPLARAQHDRRGLALAGRRPRLRRLDAMIDGVRP